MKLNPKDPKIQRNKQKISKFLKSSDVNLFYFSSPKLVEYMVTGSHPLVHSLPQKVKAILIRGDGIQIQTSMVVSWIDGTLDAKNQFLFENGQIRIVDERNMGVGELIRRAIGI